MISSPVGAAGVIVNDSAPDCPPPGLGVKTVTDAVPATAMSAAPIAARSCVALTYVVARSLPFHRTTELATKLLPVTVSVSAGPPAAALVGDRLLATGTGLPPAPTNRTASAAACCPDPPVVCT